MPRTRPGFADPHTGAETSDRGRIQVIARAAQVLRALQHYSGGASLGELAKAAELPRSTVQRIVDALDAEGLVVTTSRRGGVRLGPALLGLAAATRFDVVELARPTLEALARTTGETVDLSIASSQTVAFVDQVPGIHRLSAVSAVGVSFPMHSCANGKAVLAAMGELELRRARARLRFDPKTPNTIASWAALEADLAEIRETGIAYDHEENSLGISAVSMAFRMPDGQLAAISIPTPTQRFAAAQKSLVASLREHHQHLIQALPRHPGD